MYLLELSTFYIELALCAIALIIYQHLCAMHAIWPSNQLCGARAEASSHPDFVPCMHTRDLQLQLQLRNQIRPKQVLDT